MNVPAALVVLILLLISCSALLTKLRGSYFPDRGCILNIRGQKSESVEKEVRLFRETEGGRVEEDTEVAMEEMRNLFRSLFPILPEQTHFFWKTNHRLATIHKTASYKEEPDGGMFPWRLQIDFRKRGPDCMRKCITQGVLHPVQCHSLC